jgi:transposase-like protein
MIEPATGRKRRSQRDYTLAFKLSVVDEIEKGALNYRQAQKKYGIQGASTVLTWLRKHSTLDWTTSKGPCMQQEQTPEQRIKELETALELERKKNLLLTTMVNIAEQQYGLNIKKKFPAKRSDNSKKKDR